MPKKNYTDLDRISDAIRGVSEMAKDTAYHWRIEEQDRFSVLIRAKGFPDEWFYVVFRPPCIQFRLPYFNARLRFENPAAFIAAMEAIRVKMQQDGWRNLGKEVFDYTDRLLKTAVLEGTESI